jgi:UDP-N-acetylglucosamine--N-acetylmuramyl-(pentapeptide) pyrophosphoryl-undecaprenol N-acetylglucosamine transferase
MKNIFIAASGTGGHIYPGIAVADELKTLNPIFILSANQTSKDIISKTNYKYLTLNVCGMPGIISFKFIWFLFTLTVSFFKSLYLILKYKPAVCVGMGGYVSVPVIFAALFLPVPTVICEQNVVAGKATKLLSKTASAVCLSFDETKKYIKTKHAVVTGNPVRRDILNRSKSEALSKLNFSTVKPVVLVFGGSLGASALNIAAFEALNNMDVNVIHATGKKDFSEFSKRATPEYKIFEYLYDIGAAYAAADIVISRAGAGTVFELEYLNKYAVLVPYMHAGAHQTENAKYLLSKGLAEIIEEPKLNAHTLKTAAENALLKSKNSPFVAAMPTLPQQTIAGEILKLI